MTNVASERLSIEHCREPLGNEAGDLSQEQIATVRDHADAMAHVLIEIFLEQQSPAREDEGHLMSAVRSQSGSHQTSFEINELAAVAFRRIEPRNLCAFSHLRGIRNVVDQNSASWNRLASWLAGVESLRQAVS